ncbi:tetratricopeptide repeat protein [Nocardiopsis sp. CNS-639]|uniref:tetratricopeptide repeat protein n=1 Tax=Nocardiopsis sp. CNS-639 TaxID=1169153 RepID=UPI00036E6BF0|nr:tetratricopeptide repeat protein [Nocardiopsis sp. CNS-639]
MSEAAPQPPPRDVRNTITGNPSGLTVQAQAVYGGVGNTTHIHQSPVAPMALDAVPGPPDGFTGRGEALREVTARLDPAAAHGPGAVVVSALSGMGGVGKTALALKAAQTAWEKGWFCAHLFVDLHGYTPHTPPVEALAALDALLRQVGVDPDDIPVEVGERAGFYRAALQSLSRADERGRPVLVVADNAHHLDQVEPLLPGPGGHRLLVTSRARLAVGGHQPLSLDTLPTGEAVELITARLGTGDPRSGDTEGLAALTQRCGRLPLALKIAAALLARAPHLRPGEMAQRLDETARFTDGRDDLTAVFAASLDHLSPEWVQVFALVGSHPGPDISTAAAAALTGLEDEEVEEVLEELAAAHLLTAYPSGRWAMHDLLANHARHHPLPAQGTEQTGQEDPRQRALVRLLDFYTTTAAAADDHLRALNGDTPPAVFTGRAQALAWLEAEHDNLIAAAHTAHRIGHTTTAIRLPATLAGYLGLRRRFEEAIAVHTLARDTAHQHDDTRGEATAWTNLGNALRQARRFEEAISAHTRARDLHQQVGGARSEATAWNNLGGALREVRRFEEAIEAHTRAREAFQQVGAAHREATAWNNLGNALAEVRQFDEAIDAHTRARDLYQQVGDAHGEATAWNNLGLALRQVRQFDEAIDAHTRARDLYQQVGDAHGEATAWNNLGLALRQVRQFDEAIDAHIHDLAYCQQIGDVHGEATAWNNLGGALREVRRFEEAIQAHTRARDLHQQVGGARGEATAWNNLGGALAEVRREQEAREAFERAVQGFRATGDEHSLAIAQGNLARLHQRPRRWWQFWER